jgi:membrane-associated phospholipid phosphatase
MVKKQISTSCSKIFLIVVVLYVLVLLLQPKRFHMWYPTIPIYPDNNKEIDFMIKEYISKRTQDDIDFFYLTDAIPIDAFKSKISEELYKKLNEIVTSPEVLIKIMLYKIFFNRARPMQVAPEKINAPKSMTSDNPSYPSGHAYQSYYAAKLLSKWEPARKKEWDEIAERAAHIRVYMGIHYPSDVKFARQLVDGLKVE